MEEQMCWQTVDNDLEGIQAIQWLITSNHLITCDIGPNDPGFRVKWFGGGGGGGGGQWRKMAMANSAFSFVKFAIFRQFLIFEFHI